MNANKHLDISEIMAFRNDLLSDADRHAAARHLVRCVDCRNSLPLPTTDVFWRSVMGSDEDFAESRVHSTIWISIRDRFAELLFGRPAVKNALVFVGLVFLTILGISLLLITSKEVRQDGDLVAAIGNTYSPELFDRGNPDNLRRNDVTNTVMSSSQSDSHNSRIANRKPAKDIRVPDRKIPERSNIRTVADTRSGRQSETRGNTPCGGQRFVGFVAKLTDAGVLLMWEKVKGAIKYDVYLSDLNEKLIEHFESPDQTSHLISAELASGTVYRLRLIFTLEGGERVVSGSRNFKIGDLKRSGIRSHDNIEIRKKTAASVRCVEVKQ